MKYILFATLLLISACDGSSTPVHKIASPQLEALEKAKAVEQIVQQSANQMQEKINDAEK